MKIHLWEAYNPKKISVDIKKQIKSKIKELIKGKIYSISKKFKITPARLYDYFFYQDSPIPLNVLISLSREFNISLKEIEQKIVMYKQMFVPNKNSIKNPMLPIKMTPYLTSIIANLYFDGSVPKDGKGTYYNQKDKTLMDNFVKKLKFVFGDVFYSIKKDHRGVLKCSIPRIIGEICKNIYNIESFGTFDSKISNKLFRLSKEHKISFVLTAISDEGSITYDGDIFFGVNNKNLCNDVQKLCNQIGLKTTGIRERPKGNHYFYIKSKKDFLKILRDTKKTYSLLTLNNKQERLEHHFKTKQFPGLRTKKGGDKRKERILGSLKKRLRTINNLTKELIIPPRSLRRHLSFLIKIGKVKRTKKGNQYYYGLTIPH